MVLLPASRIYYFMVCTWWALKSVCKMEVAVVYILCVIEMVVLDVDCVFIWLEVLNTTQNWQCWNRKYTEMTDCGEDSVLCKLWLCSFGIVKSCPVVVFYLNKDISLLTVPLDLICMYGLSSASLCFQEDSLIELSFYKMS